MSRRQTAYEQNLRLLARRLDQGYPLTPELKSAIAALVSATARTARAERAEDAAIDGVESECRAVRHGSDTTCTCEDSRGE